LGVASYFFRQEPKQFFMGAELCARWYLLYKGDLGSVRAGRILDYSGEAQEVFSWMLAGKAYTSLVGHVGKRKFNAKIIAALSEGLAESAACADSVFNKIFVSKEPRLKPLKAAADTIADLADLKGLCANHSWSGTFGKIKCVSSLCLTLLSAAAAYGVKSCIMPRVNLLLDTTVFITKFMQFSFKK
jgi:hypothetical protein